MTSSFHVRRLVVGLNAQGTIGLTHSSHFPTQHLGYQPGPLSDFGTGHTHSATRKSFQSLSVKTCEVPTTQDTSPPRTKNFLPNPSIVLDLLHGPPTSLDLAATTLPQPQASSTSFHSPSLQPSRLPQVCHGQPPSSRMMQQYRVRVPYIAQLPSKDSSRLPHNFVRRTHNMVGVTRDEHHMHGTAHYIARPLLTF